MRSAPEAPDSRERGSYQRLEVDGVEVFVHRGVVQSDRQVSVKLGGFWKLRWLKVTGLASLAACAASAGGSP